MPVADGWEQAVCRFSCKAPEPPGEQAACAGYQAPAEFWRFHDFLMANQSDLTPDSLGERLRLLASQGAALDGKRLQDCVDNHEADAVLLRDEQLARLYRVDSTPTVFIDGVRSQGLHSAEELGWAIRRAALERKRKTDPVC